MLIQDLLVVVGSSPDHLFRWQLLVKCSALVGKKCSGLCTEGRCSTLLAGVAVITGVAKEPCGMSSSAEVGGISFRHIVVFDLESTGGSAYTTRIIQLSAAVWVPGASGTAAMFDCHILPPEPISFKSQNLTRMDIKYICGTRRLIKNSRVIESVPPTEGLRSFID